MGIQDEPVIHIPVMLDELLEHVPLHDDRQNIIVDATLGLAGHASEIVKRMHPGDIFIGFDADQRNLQLAREKLTKIQTEYFPEGEIEIVLIHSNFEMLGERLADLQISHPTAIYYDLWVSSAHFDEAERGFSLRLQWPLDMRFDTRSGPTAADILNFWEKDDIYQILREYGEEPHARKIAERVITARKQQKFVTTSDLTEFLNTQINSHIKTKMRVFQALRIAVNRELEVLETSLQDAIEILAPGGTIFVISFHSLEDRIVKNLFRQEAKDCICSDIVCTCWHQKQLLLQHKKPLLPTQEEQTNNPRSRSAKARYAQKI